MRQNAHVRAPRVVLRAGERVLKEHRFPPARPSVSGGHFPEKLLACGLRNNFNRRRARWDRRACIHRLSSLEIRQLFPAALHFECFRCRCRSPVSAPRVVEILLDVEVARSGRDRSHRGEARRWTTRAYVFMSL